MIEKPVHRVLCPRGDLVGEVARRGRACPWRVHRWWRVHKPVSGHAFNDPITIDRDGTFVNREDAVRSHASLFDVFTPYVGSR